MFVQATVQLKSPTQLSYRLASASTPRTVGRTSLILWHFKLTESLGFRSWVSRTHTFYLTAPDRRPTENETTTVQKLQPRLDQLFRAHGEVEISHVQVFAQMYKLETANSLIIPILNMNNFFPHKLTVTIRHRKSSSLAKRSPAQHHMFCPVDLGSC